MRETGYYWVLQNPYPHIEEDWSEPKVAFFDAKDGEWYVTFTDVPYYETQIRVICGPLEKPKETA